MKIDTVTVWALRVLREELMYRDCTNDLVADAIATLDNAGVFAPVDEYTGYDVEA